MKIIFVDLSASLQRGQGPRSAVQNQIGTQAPYTRVGTEGGDRREQGVRQGDSRQPLPGCVQPLTQGGLLRVPGGLKTVRVRLESHAPAHDVRALRRFPWGLDIHAQAEAVQKLRPQRSLFGIHAAHQGKAGGLLDAQAVALHPVNAHGRGVQQDVDQMVGKQVDLIDIQHAAVGCGDQAAPEPGLTAQCGVQVQAAHHPVLTGAQGQVDKRRRLAVLTCGQQRRQAARGSAFRCAAVAPDQDATEFRSHRQQRERQQQFGLMRHRTQRVLNLWAHPLTRAVSPRSSSRPSLSTSRPCRAASVVGSGDHSPRPSASSSRVAMAFSAQGLLSRKKA
ncbi:hypothetical protein DEDE109153_14135 [Deinococcus deserti]